MFGKAVTKATAIDITQTPSVRNAGRRARPDCRLPHCAKSKNHCANHTGSMYAYMSCRAPPQAKRKADPTRLIIHTTLPSFGLLLTAASEAALRTSTVAKEARPILGLR